MTVAVQAIGWTRFTPPADVAWAPEPAEGDDTGDDTGAGDVTGAAGGEALVEFAGRSCYESWDRPNPATATNAAYVRHLLEVGHAAALEHAVVTLWIRDVSQACAHRLVRHRQLSVSQLSARHVPDGPHPMVAPPGVAGDPELQAVFDEAAAAADRAYRAVLDGLQSRLDGADPQGTGRTASLRRKQARQAAAALLPGAAATHLVVTANCRAWRHVVAAHAGEHADPELRALALAVLRELQRVVPNLVADFEVTALPDGSEVASSPLIADS